MKLRLIARRVGVLRGQLVPIKLVHLQAPPLTSRLALEPASRQLVRGADALVGGQVSLLLLLLILDDGSTRMLGLLLGPGRPVALALWPRCAR